MDMDLIQETFKRCEAEKRAAFVAYVTAGDPDFDTSLSIIDSLVAGGIDILELGVPFSDPLADGRANQLAAERALEAGITSWKVLELAAKTREKHPTLPLVLFTYLNPIAYSGDFHDFCKKAVASGVNSVLPLDLPPEEAEDYRRDIDGAGLGVVSLIAPTSPPERVELITKGATSFIYYVCREGVTGQRTEFADGVNEKIDMIKKHTTLPIVVGFGISQPEHVKAAASTGVAGVVVGSAIVNMVEQLSKGETTLDQIQSFVSSMTSALR